MKFSFKGCINPSFGGKFSVGGNFCFGNLAQQQLNQDLRSAVLQTATQDFSQIDSILKNLAAEYGPSVIQAATGCISNPSGCPNTLKSLAASALPMVAQDAANCLNKLAGNPTACDFTPQQSMNVARTIAQQSLKFKFNACIKPSFGRRFKIGGNFCFGN